MSTSASASNAAGIEQDEAGRSLGSRHASARQRVNYQAWAIAATSVVLVTGASRHWGFMSFPALAMVGREPPSNRSMAALYRVSGSGSGQLISAGTELKENDTCPHREKFHRDLRLNDGSKVEMNQRARSLRNQRVDRFHRTSQARQFIVAAAKQRRGYCTSLTVRLQSLGERHRILRRCRNQRLACSRRRRNSLGRSRREARRSSQRR